MRTPIKSLFGSLVLGLALAAGGCGETEDAIDEVEEVFDCTAICTAYEDCIDPDNDFDSTQCISDCEDMVEASTTFEAQAETCTECVTGDSCDDASGFLCEDECAGIVP